MDEARLKDPFGRLLPRKVFFVPPKPPSETVAVPPLAPPQADARHVGGLFMLCTLAAMDGTIALLAAGGRLSTWGGAVAAGLTTIAGAGAWIAARQAFGGRRRTARDYGLLTLLGAVTAGAAVAAASLGALIGSRHLEFLPKAAGLALLLVAAEVAGLRVPRAKGVPLPLVVALAGGVLEVLRWTP